MVVLFPQDPQILVHSADDEYGYDHYTRPAQYRRDSQVDRFGGERPTLSGDGQQSPDRRGHGQQRTGDPQQIMRAL